MEAAQIGEQKQFTAEQIRNHFIINPEWKVIYLAKFGEPKTEEYLLNFLNLMEQNGYVFNERRYNNRPGSTFYVLKFVEMYRKELGQDDPEWIEYGPNHETSAYNEILLDCVCDYKIDFENFK